MKKLIEVKEFDSIICKIEYENSSDRIRYISPEAFDELEQFIREYSQSGENADALDFFKIGYKRPYGKVITVRNYVGVIKLKSGYQIQIMPKIFFEDSDNGNDRTKAILVKMLRCLKEFDRKQLNEANLDIRRMNMYEVFINMYINKVRELVKHGLKSSYVNREDNLNFYRGKLQVATHIKYNFVHGERFFVSYDEYMINRPENRLIKSTILKLQNISESDNNKKSIRQLLPFFEQVELSKNYEKDFSQVIIDRNTNEYELIMMWSKVFLMNKSFSSFAGESQAVSILFPMEKVFEAYVVREMKKSFGSRGSNVKAQVTGMHLFDEPRKFAMRPDILVELNNGKKVIMDTKWKLLSDNVQSNYGISQGDMYQMYAYAKRFKIPNIVLLYPINNSMRNHSLIEYKSFQNEDDVDVKVFFIDLDKIRVSMDELYRMITEE